MNQISVCHLTSVHPAFDNRILQKECVSLAEAGFEVTLLAGNAEEQDYKGVRIRSVPIPRNRLWRMTWGAARMFFAAISQKARIYHFHDPELMPVGLMLRLLGKTVIADVHENTSAALLSRPYLNPAFARVFAAAIGVFERFSLAFMSGVVTVHPSISSRFPRSHPVTIYNYPILPNLEHVEKAHIPGSKPGIIYVGGLTGIRGIRELISAFHHVETAELWLLGPFETEEFRAECESLPGWENTRYLGVTTPAGIFSYLKSAAAGIITFLPYPNHINALPTKPFEYMAAGLPMIMSNFPYWKEYFGDSALYTDPSNSNEISHTVKTLLSDRELMDKMGAVNLYKSGTQFSWKEQADKLVSLYHRLTERNV